MHSRLIPLIPNYKRWRKRITPFSSPPSRGGKPEHELERQQKGDEGENEFGLAFFDD